MFASGKAGLATSLVAALLVSACAGIEGDRADLTTGAIPPSDQRPQDEPVALGKLHFSKGDYGLAERYFRAAVEANPKSSEAWLGLAASYDRLRRFDLAERAYKQLQLQVPRSAAVLNNLGYHHLLRGNLQQARTLLLEAARIDPSNAHIQGNLRLLGTWHRGEHPSERQG
jgi:Flp pilus assembly protein TadD